MFEHYIMIIIQSNNNLAYLPDVMINQLLCFLYCLEWSAHSLYWLTLEYHAMSNVTGNQRSLCLICVGDNKYFLNLGKYMTILMSKKTFSENAVPLYL